MEKLSQKYKQNEGPIFRYGLDRNSEADENISSRFGSNHFDSEGDYDSDEDDYKRRKKSLNKKKRFREFFRKRNSYQNRFKKFRENF